MSFRARDFEDMLARARRVPNANFLKIVFYITLAAAMPVPINRSH